MATANLNKEGWGADYGNEGIIIIRDLADVPGGRTLDVTDWPLDYIPAGTIVGIDAQTGTPKPLGIAKNSKGEYEYAPNAGETMPIGVLKATITKAEPFAAIMTMGEVNLPAVPFGVNKFLDIMATEAAAAFTKGIVFGNLDAVSEGDVS